MIFSGESATAHYFHGFTLHFRQILKHCFLVSELKTHISGEEANPHSSYLPFLMNHSLVHACLCAQEKIRLRVYTKMHKNKRACLFLFKRDMQGYRIDCQLMKDKDGPCKTMM